MKTLGMDTGYRVVKGFGIVGDVAIRRLTVNLVCSMSFSIKTTPPFVSCWHYTSLIQRVFSLAMTIPYNQDGV